MFLISMEVTKLLMKLLKKVTFWTSNFLQTHNALYSPSRGWIKFGNIYMHVKIHLSTQLYSSPSRSKNLKKWHMWTAFIQGQIDCTQQAYEHPLASSQDASIIKLNALCHPDRIAIAKLSK